jgi:AbrB family looped-hinge helix DNA binding protein
MASQNFIFQYLPTTKIDGKGQLTIPKKFRDDLGLSKGACFSILRVGDGLILMPEQQRFEQLCEKISLKLTIAGISPERVLATLAETRERIYERNYGKSRASRRYWTGGRKSREK